MIESNFGHRNKQRKRRTSKALCSRQESWLIVTEGTVTEPNYFNGVCNYLKTQYPQKINIKFVIEGAGKNTQSLVRSVDDLLCAASKISRNALIKYSRIFVVFDKDSFEAQQFDNAIYQAKAKGYVPLWSNECIELWFLLHFELLQSDIGREQYAKKLSKYFSKKYDKTASDIFDVIICKGGNLKTAIENAKLLYNNSCNVMSPSQRVPCTTMFRFFDELEKQEGIKSFIT